MTYRMTPEEVLEKAVDVLHTYGWTQGSSGNHVDGYCAIGAVYQATDGDCSAASKALALLHQETGFAPGRLVHPVARWNDATGRTVEDVILAMKKAANQ